jgi:FlaA1/EpsC-like NDP-sugar epimerase
MTPKNTPWSSLDAWMNRLRPHRRWLVPLVDLLLVALCWNLTYLFRLGFERWIEARPAHDHWVLLGVLSVYATALWRSGVPAGLWRFAGFAEVRAIALACAVAGLVSAAGVMGLGLRQVPRAVLALHPLITLMGLVLARLAVRVLYERARQELAAGVETRRALVLGAGEAASRLLAGLLQQGWEVPALLDDDPTKRHARLAGVPVEGSIDDLLSLVQRHHATHLVIAMPSATTAQRRRVLAAAATTGLPVLTVPGADELVDGTQRAGRVRDIEPEDLLGRPPVQLDESGIAAVLQGQVVLITGAGGSIGSELCRQLARWRPAELVLYDVSEFNLYSIEQELGASHPGLRLRPLVGDVRDLDHLRLVMADCRPAVVFHAAAYKHVPMMEERNAWSAVRNNVLGTWNAALAAAEAGVGRFVLISTDKAVNPTNVMGATKRAAEMVVSSLAGTWTATRFMAVRFGNVLGSSGSVIPKFKEQIARGGPVTVTHPDIIRYFMTIPEAARLVLQAAAIGESGQVLVLDMGEPVRIVDLARDMIRLSGHAEDEIEIVFSGLRPGEKLFEELLADADATLPTSIERLRIARLERPDPALAAWLDWAKSQPTVIPDPQVRQALRTLVPEYRPSSVRL